MLCLSFINLSATAQSQSSSIVLLDSLESLSVDQEKITLNLEGFFYEVHSLQKMGNHWEATL